MASSLKDNIPVGDSERDPNVSSIHCYTSVETKDDE